MKICVQGLWHLGSVVAACLANADHAVVGLADDAAAAAGLSAGQPPIAEPGLSDRIRRGIAAGQLRFTADPLDAVRDADILWIAFDTPVDEHDRADPDAVIQKAERVIPLLKRAAIVVIQSQLPVGTIARLEERASSVHRRDDIAFACVPENLRLGSAIQSFECADFMVLGTRNGRGKDVLQPVLRRFAQRVVLTSIESAELTKHALNTFLAGCVVFINEIASVAEHVGADAREVEQALRCDPRVGRRAYLRPGGPFAGATLARDVRFLMAIAQEHEIAAPFFAGIWKSNEEHKLWPRRQLIQRLGTIAGRRIAVLGLTYKAGTDTLRRSQAIELCQFLAGNGAHVAAYDPSVRSLPETLPVTVRIAVSAEAALDGAEAAVLCTNWTEFEDLDADSVVARMAEPLIIDAVGLAPRNLVDDARVRYAAVGKSP